MTFGLRGTWELEEAPDAEELVNRVCSEVERAGVKAKAQVGRSLSGQVAQAILDDAEAEGVGLVVMGSRGLPDLRGLMLGSVTHKAIQLSQCPVLVAR